MFLHPPISILDILIIALSVIIPVRKLTIHFLDEKWYILAILEENLKY